MDPKELRGLVEAYSEVYAPQEEIGEAVKGADPEMRKAASAERRAGDKPLPKGEGEKYSKFKASQISYIDKKTKGKYIHGMTRENLDIFDVVLEFLQAEGFAETLEEAEWIMANELDAEDIEEILEAEGSYGATPKAYSAARQTKMTAKRKPFLKKMLRRTNPANRTDPYDSPRKGLTADDRERARAGSAHGVGTRQDHDYPSQGPGGVTKSAKKLRKQKAMGEHD